MTSRLYIREIAIADTDAAAELSAELGYPVLASVMAERIQHITSRSDHIVYVACLAGAVVGWIDVGITHHLQSDPYAEIGGLVVSSAHRGNGIGKMLVSKAEEWAIAHEVSRILVRSRTTRERAHRFYIREGYAQTKVSSVFSKMLSPV